MRRFLTVVCVCLHLATIAQGDLSSGNSILKFEAGVTTFRPYAVNDFLFGTGAFSRFTDFYTIGFTNIGQTNTGRYLSFDNAVSLHFFLPREVVVIPDTLKYRAGGWELMTSFFGFDLVNSARANTDLVIAPGMYWGTMRIKKYAFANPRSYELFKNGFIAPMVRVDLRVQFWKISLGGRVSWRYGVSSLFWRKGASVHLPDYRCEEWQYMAYIGIWLNSNK